MPVPVSPTIRPAVAGDVPGLSALAGRTFPLACPPELPASAVEEFIAKNLGEESFHGYLTDPGYSVLVAQDPQGAIRAYALLVEGTAMDEACAELIHARPCLGVSKFYVDPEWHGAGLATRLLDACVASGGATGVRSLWLATNVANRRARAFYAKNGFLERGHRVFTVGSVRNDDVVLELPI